MSERLPSPAERRGWHLRGASSPAKVLALDGRSARGLLALLEARDDEAAVTARAQLAGAVASGRLDAIREAMDAARRVLPVVDAPAEAPAIAAPSVASPRQVLEQLDARMAVETDEGRRVEVARHRDALAAALDTRDGRAALRAASRAAEALGERGSLRAPQSEQGTR